MSAHKIQIKIYHNFVANNGIRQVFAPKTVFSHEHYDMADKSMYEKRGLIFDWCVCNSLSICTPRARERANCTRGWIFTWFFPRFLVRCFSLARKVITRALRVYIQVYAQTCVVRITYSRTVIRGVYTEKCTQ